MGFFDNPFTAIATALNPVSMVANLGFAGLSGGLDYIGGESDRRSQEAMNAQQLQLARDQMAMQKEFAQSGIRWRVEDAVKAGLHPLAALGVQGAQYSPVAALMEAPKSPWSSVSRSLGNFGQDVTRALMATKSQEERMLDHIRLRNEKLQGDFIQEQIEASRAERASKVGPAFPVSSPLDLVPEIGDSSRMTVVPSRSWAERNAGDIGGQVGWRLNYKMLPFVGIRGDLPANAVLSDGTTVHYNWPGYYSRKEHLRYAPNIIGAFDYMTDMGGQQ